MAADVLALQEVDRGTRRSGERDQVEELARGRYPYRAFHKTMDTTAARMELRS